MAIFDLTLCSLKNITAIGLMFDLLGVGLLGIDLIRVQNSNKRQSDNDQDILNRVSEDFGGVESWLEDITKMGRWNTGTMDEGRYVFHDEFDGDAAERAFSDLAKASLASQQNIERIATLVAGQIENSYNANRSSLKWSWLGLMFIVVGFSLQLAGTIL